MAENTTQRTLSSSCLLIQYFNGQTRQLNEVFVIFFVVLNSIVALISSLSNLLVIITLLRTPSLRTPSYILVIGLAVADFGVAAIGQPSYCVLKMAELRGTLDRFCSYGLVYYFTIVLVSSTSFFLLTCIAADRFLAIHLHLRYQEVATMTRYAILVAIIYIFCLVSGIGSIFIMNFTFKVVYFCLFIFLIILTLYFFVRISLAIRRHSAQIQAQQETARLHFNLPRYKKSVNTMKYVMGAYILCYAPNIITLLVFVKLVNIDSEAYAYFVVVCDAIWMANGLLNPIIYCLRIKEIREALDRLVRRFRTVHISS